jgi:hypothetical protein
VEDVKIKQFDLPASNLRAVYFQQHPFQLRGNLCGWIG